MARYTLVFPPDETKQYYVAWYNHYYYNGNYYIQSNVLNEPIRSVNNFYDDYYSNIISSSAFKQGDPVQNYEYPVDVDVSSVCWCVISLSFHSLYCITKNLICNVFSLSL